MDRVCIESRAGLPAKVSYVARGLLEAGYGRDHALRLDERRDQRPRTGDLVLCRVTDLGFHKALGQAQGRRTPLFLGDEVVIAYGSRYAPDQYEAELPPDTGPCELAAAGGLAARVVSRHERMSSPTRLCPVGLLTDDRGTRINLRDLARPVFPFPASCPPVVAVLGTSMNAGKTTACASLIRGLSVAGYRVGAAKVTGTGAPGDPWRMTSAGASQVLDFTDVGHPSTYRLSGEEVVRTLRALVADLTEHVADVIVLEIADGLLQRETAELLAAPEFQELVHSALFAAGDAMGGAVGVRELRQRGLPVAALTGRVTSSPLAVAEVAALADVPVIATDALEEPANAVTFLPAEVRPAVAEEEGVPVVEWTGDAGDWAQVAGERAGDEQGVRGRAAPVEVLSGSPSPTSVPTSAPASTSTPAPTSTPTSTPRPAA
ncbi:DUF1611 domain-containing protein [Streptomyces sp. ODS28]|uniref:DUF1611 domain-containing protein n=1 Tax=Streptomyces sp. ODS28 TaxID=3136688 RepID=UPI0031E74D90